jgi:teichuronic acid exporter
LFKNILWDLIGKFGSQAIYFGISIILTRLLSPQEYGILGMAMVIITFAHIFLDFGFNRAIVQSKEISDVQLSTVFLLNVFLALFLTIVCFFIAAPLAKFYNQPIITPVFRVLSISFLLNGLSLVPSSLLYRQLRFKANSIINIIATIVSGAVGIWLALHGYGVWSLVMQSIISVFVSLILMFFICNWLPSFQFALSSIQSLWHYGSRLFASGVLDTLYTRLDVFIIGKTFSTNTLGFYTRAQTMDNLVRQFSATSIMGSLFPYIAKHQNDRIHLREFYLKYLHIVLFVSIGLSGLLFLTAKDLFIVLFTSKWVYSAELFRLMSLLGFGWPVSSLMCNIISGVGNSRAFFRLEVYKKIMFLPVYLFGFLFGLKGFIICMISVGFLGVIINAFFTGKEIDLTTFKQMNIIFQYIVVGTVACLCSVFIHLYVSPFILTRPFLDLCGLAISFTGIYLLLSYLLRLEGTYVIEKSYKKLKLVWQ